MKSKGNHSSALHEEHRSLSHTALSVHRATGTAQAAVPCFHLEQFLMAQQIEVSKWPEELQHFTLPHTKKTGLYVRQAAKLRREHHTCTSLGDSLPTACQEKTKVTRFHTWGGFLVSQRATSANCREAALCLHCHEPVWSRTNAV